MFELFLNDQNAHIIFPVTPVEDNICMINPVDGYLFPVFRNLKTGSEMKLYRKIGMHISVFGQQTEPRTCRELRYEVPWYEGRDIQELEDIPFAEFWLNKRKEKMR
jgi:hypothetical protein